jgi:hypothetical protein
MTANVQPPEDIDTDWASIALRAFNMAIAVGAIEPADDEEPDPWAADMPGWRRAAAEYHKSRDDRRAVVETDPQRLGVLRQLMPKRVPIERAWHVLNRKEAAPTSTLEALMYSLRQGTAVLTNPDNQRRLSELSEEQLREVCERLQNFKPEIATAWTSAEVQGLIAVWRKIHG